MLKTLRDRETHQVYTSIWVAFLSEKGDIIQLENDFTKTNITFSKEIMTDKKIVEYVHSTNWCKRAGGYAV